MTVLLEGNKQGHPQIHHKLYLLQVGKGKNANVSITDDRYTRLTLQQDCHRFNDRPKCLDMRKTSTSLPLLTI